MAEDLGSWTEDSLGSMLVKNLKSICLELGIDQSNAARKADIIDTMLAFQEERATTPRPDTHAPDSPEEEPHPMRDRPQSPQAGSDAVPEQPQQQQPQQQQQRSSVLPTPPAGSSYAPIGHGSYASRPAPEGDRNNLIINYLPQAVTEGGLRALFEPYGALERVKLMVDMDTGRSLGFGFVKYVTNESAAKAVAAVNGYQMEDKTIKVSYARPKGGVEEKKSLYVAHLPPTFGEADIRKLFAPYGSVQEIKVMTDKHTGMGKGVAFVKYESIGQAEQAIHGMNGQLAPGGRLPLVVKFADSPKDKRRRQDDRGRDRDGGGRGDRRGRRHSSGDRGGGGRGRGGYAAMRPGVSPSMRYNPYPPAPAAPPAAYPGYPPAPYPPAWGAAPYGMPPNPYAMPMPGWGAAPAAAAASPMWPGAGPPVPAAPQQGAPASMSANGDYALFVYGLTNDMTESILNQMFSPYGQLANCKVVVDPMTGNCKGYGFVHYPRLEEAQAAIMGLNGAQYNGRTLQVSFKRQKCALASPAHGLHRRRITE